MMINKLLPFSLIPILCLFTYQAVKNSIAAVQLNNTSYYLQQIFPQFSISEQGTSQDLLNKAQNALNNVQQLTPDNPTYHHLQANAKLWQVLIKPEPKAKANSLLAQQHYRLALQAQPNNPFLWIDMAKSDLAQAKQASSLNAIRYANLYAPSDYAILSNTVFWLIPQWSNLNHQQQTEIIKQLKQLAKHKKSNHKTTKQLNSLIKQTGQKAIICSKLPRTEKFRPICL